AQSHHALCCPTLSSIQENSMLQRVLVEFRIKKRLWSNPVVGPPDHRDQTILADFSNERALPKVLVLTINPHRAARGLVKLKSERRIADAVGSQLSGAQACKFE